MTTRLFRLVQRKSLERMIQRQSRASCSPLLALLSDGDRSQCGDSLRPIKEGTEGISRMRQLSANDGLSDPSVGPTAQSLELVFSQRIAWKPMFETGFQLFPSKDRSTPLGPAAKYCDTP